MKPKILDLFCGAIDAQNKLKYNDRYKSQRSRSNFMPIITCLFCHKEVEAERKTKKYCSELCGVRHRTGYSKERTCIECGIVFQAETRADAMRQYCSQKCAKRHNHKPATGEIRLCQVCGKESTKKTCSTCYARIHRGYPKERLCKRCGTSFKILTQDDANRQYCSKDCSKTSNKERIKAWTDEHPDAMGKYNKNRVTKNPQIWSENWQKERLGILELLGGKCVVCGVTNPFWLHVDYIPTTRDKPYRHPRHLAYIRKHREDFRLLCANHHYELTLTGMIEGTDITQ